MNDTSNSTSISGSIRLLGNVLGAIDQKPELWVGDAWKNFAHTESRESTTLAGRAVKIVMRTSEEYGNYQYLHHLFNDHGAEAVKTVLKDALAHLRKELK